MKERFTLYVCYHILFEMIVPLLLQNAMMLPLTMVGNSPMQDGFSNLLNKPADNFTWIVVMAVALVALVGLVIYLVKKWHDDRAASRP